MQQIEENQKGCVSKIQDKIQLQLLDYSQIWRLGFIKRQDFIRGCLASENILQIYSILSTLEKVKYREIAYNINEIIPQLLMIIDTSDSPDIITSILQLILNKKYNFMYGSLVFVENNGLKIFMKKLEIQPFTVQILNIIFTLYQEDEIFQGSFIQNEGFKLINNLINKEQDEQIMCCYLKYISKMLEICEFCPPICEMSKLILSISNLVKRFLNEQNLSYICQILTNIEVMSYRLEKVFIDSEGVQALVSLIMSQKNFVIIDGLLSPIIPWVVNKKQNSQKIFDIMFQNLNEISELLKIQQVSKHELQKTQLNLLIKLNTIIKYGTDDHVEILIDNYGFLKMAVELINTDKKIAINILDEIFIRGIIEGSQINKYVEMFEEMNGVEKIHSSFDFKFQGSTLDLIANLRNQQCLNQSKESPL